jgi:hypothetical protein
MASNLNEPLMAGRCYFNIAQVYIVRNEDEADRANAIMALEKAISTAQCSLLCQNVDCLRLLLDPTRAGFDSVDMCSTNLPSQGFTL